MQELYAVAGEKIIRAFLEALDREFSSYCLLAGYEELPFRSYSDIDFMMGRRDFERVPQMLAAFSQEVGFPLVQYVRHETTAVRYDLVRNGLGQVIYLHPDSCSDYRRHNRTWLRSEEILARRRRHPNGFWIPAAADGFIYYFCKRIEKLNIEERHTQQLSRLFSEDEQGSADALAKRLTAASARLVVQAARSGDWQPVIEAVQLNRTMELD